MADTPEPPKADGKGPLKKGLLTGKNKWYVIGGLGIVAVLVFYFVSRSSSSGSAGSTTTSGTAGMDPATQAALQSALQGQGAAGYAYQAATGPSGVAGPPGATGARGKPGKPGKNAQPGKPPHRVPHKPPPHKRVGHTTFTTVRPGDTLSSIASRNHIRGGWETLYRNNRSVVGSNPNTIHPGQRLKI